MISNLLRCTVCRSTEFMVSLWVSHVRLMLEYGSYVWNVKYLMDARRVESLQKTLDEGDSWPVRDGICG